MSVYQPRLQGADVRSDRRFPAGQRKSPPSTSPSPSARRCRRNRSSELVDWVKANPTQGSYGTPAAGTLPHFFAVLVRQAPPGLDLRHVGYRGSAAALTDLVGGQIPIVVTTTSDLLEQHKAGRIRVLATSDGQPLAVPAGRCRPSRRPATTSRAQAGTASSRRPRRLQMSSSASTRRLPPPCRRRW